MAKPSPNYYPQIGLGQLNYSISILIQLPLAIVLHFTFRNIVL